ncbi:25242_t:CDS:2 [Racocetra persica]|uniref:25242_t:CDS:1 n=1 Tax=Racocetra persica TaxID=160502 RepID=A0ACA9R8Q3_9GLOM|nr:25242_t:CDS:2 [Racocetra persica]
MVRLKHRWILFETLFEDTSHQDTSVEPLTSHNIFTTVKESIQSNFGDYGRGCVSSSLNVKYYSPHTNIGLLRVSRDHYRIVWCALTFITQINSRTCTIRVLHVGGTIKQCQTSVIEYDMEQILENEDLDDV